MATVLAAHVSDVFGLMGNGNAYLIDALARLTDVTYHAVRHETATVASADAYHRVSRRIAVATATYGAGFTNTITSLAEAVRSYTPLLLIAGDAPTTGMRDWDLDQTAIATACGATTFVIDPATPGATTLAALRHAVRERTAVVLSVPYDVPTADAADETLDLDAPLDAEPVALDEGAARAAAEALLAAERPLVLAGRGGRAAAADLWAVADAIGALTVSSAPARGTFAGRTLDLGVAGGFGSERTLGYMRDADVVLVVGASLNQFTTAFGTALGEHARVFRVDDRDVAPNPAVTDLVRGDASLAAAAIRGIVERAEQAVPRERWAGVDPEHVAGAQFDREPGNDDAPADRLDPRSLMRELDAIVPEQRIVASDGGHFLGWVHYHWRLPSADSITLVGTQFQSIGLGFPSAPGVAAAAPDRTLTVVTGDGGGLMGLADLDSVVRAARSAIIIVFNDAAYTAEVTQYGTIGLDQRAMLIDRVDFAKFAEGVGATGVVVRTLDDLQAVRDWAERGAEGTILLDCRIDGSIVAPFQQEIIENMHKTAKRIQR
ncbi:thiamine pyrophosphate-binding protein [Pseudoclavibacter endophyticus]|uniref:Thiamine pyrophosphate-binding protein n=2 Tax=Pseudoclavibacter endophyticus TaxID=1778590 RepID=A0A6H9WBF2_9MICO|nr:thiamine pyrophosphate-binding protein [Pseudoclavibacter endophyticus]